MRLMLGLGVDVSIRESKLGLNTAWRILSTGSLAEAARTGLDIETCKLSSPIECVEELHPEERLQSIRMHGNLFRQAQVFSVTGKFTNRERFRCVAKGKVRCDDERRRVQSDALPPLPAAAVITIHILP